MIRPVYIPSISRSEARALAERKPLISWWAVRGSNPRPSPCKGDGNSGPARAALSTAHRNDPLSAFVVTLSGILLAGCQPVCPGVPPDIQEAADNWYAFERGAERVRERDRREHLDPTDPEYLESDSARRRREASAWPLYVPGASEPADGACVDIFNPSPAVDGIWSLMTWHRADGEGAARVSGDGATTPARADEGWRWRACEFAP